MAWTRILGSNISNTTKLILSNLNFYSPSGIFGLPFGTTAQRPTVPEPATIPYGTIRYNLTKDSAEIYNTQTGVPDWNGIGSETGVDAGDVIIRTNGTTITKDITIGPTANNDQKYTYGLLMGDVTIANNITVDIEPGAGLLIYDEPESVVAWNPDHLLGLSSEYAAPSAAAILQSNPNSPDGVYWINLPTKGPTQIYCLMDQRFDGGGWMMMMKATRGTTFEYNASYWTQNNTLNPITGLNRQDGDAKFNVMNDFAATDIMAIWPDISNGGSLPTTPYGWTWLEKNFNGSPIVPITFWSTADRRFKRDAKLFSGWANGKFSSQTDVRFYGFNYRNDPGWARTRWGFGWNENGGGLYPNGNMGSDDVSGGIGMTSNFGSYSAGDRINCCSDSTGINRSARVEVYIR